MIVVSGWRDRIPVDLNGVGNRTTKLLPGGNGVSSLVRFVRNGLTHGEVQLTSDAKEVFRLSGPYEKWEEYFMLSKDCAWPVCEYVKQRAMARSTF